VLLTATLAAILAWSWAKWPDVVIDFGRELYVPWRLSEGDVLYRDIAYFNGPLSPYWNALWFKMFGVSVWTLVVVNSVLLAALLVLVYRLIDAIADRGAAVLACLTLLLVFAAGHYDWCGNFNWICPYSHEVTHGIGLSLLSLYLLHRHYATRHWLPAASSGLIVGLVFLTKAEIFLALAIACFLAWGAMFKLQKPVARVAVHLAVFAVAAFVAPATAFVLLRMALPSNQAISATLGSWPHVSVLIGNPYYRALRGTDALGLNLSIVLLASAAYLLAIGVLIWLSLVLRQHRRSNAWSAGIIFLAALLITFLIASSLWTELLRPWPLFALALVLGAAQQIWRSDEATFDRRRLVLRLALGVFSLCLLARIVLRTRVLHYGFGLAMPATILLVAAAWTWIPARIAAWGGDAKVYRAALLAFWLGAVAQFAALSDHWYRAKTYSMGTGGDQFLADDRAPYLAAAMDAIAKEAKVRDTLAVLPEGVMLNYLLRMPNPTPYINFIPPEMLMFGEGPMLAALSAHPPDWIVLTQRDTAEFGARVFGFDYGQQILRWVEDHYEVAAQFESPPPVYAVMVVRRKASERGDSSDDQQ
jgi:hypothetical protein